MKDKNIEKVLQVWNEKNSIENPNQRIKLEIIEQIASMFAAGPYYYFIFNYETVSFDYVSKEVKNVLGYDPSIFSLQFMMENLHEEDLDNLKEKEAISFDFLYKNIQKEDIPLYKVCYLVRIKSVDGTYRTILHQSRTINTTSTGKIQQVICVNTDVTHLNVPFNHNVSYIGLNRPSFYATEKNGVYQITDKHLKDNFTKKEKEIIKKLAEGKIYTKIAEELFIAPSTVNTHKRNILRKAECKNTAELIRKCISEGVI